MLTHVDAGPVRRQETSSTVPRPLSWAGWWSGREGDCVSPWFQVHHQVDIVVPGPPDALEAPDA
jgi:hypothetical protein